MSDPFFFGYGSLVNRSTHNYEEAFHARVTGWRRVWRPTRLREMAFLTAERAPGTEIEGLIASVPGGNWTALDEREAGYLRHPVSDSLVHTATRPVAAQIYAVPADYDAGPGTQCPILLSYLDIVVQGYLREFGEAGALRFFETTAGWEAPILDDRADPRYPRHRKLLPSEAAFVDDQLSDRAARRMPG